MIRAVLLIVLLTACSDDRPPGARPVPGPADTQEGGQPPQYDWQGGEGEGEPALPGPLAEGEGEGQGPDAADPPVGGSVEVDPALIDFGFLAEGVVASRQFEVKATGQAPVTVEEVSITWDSSRDFAITAGPQRPVTIQPGEAEGFVVTYAQVGAEGDEGAIWIRTDATDNPDLSVRLQARRKEGPQDIHVEPPEIHYGRRGVGAVASAFVSILNVGGNPLAVRSLSFDPPGWPFTLADGQAEPFDLAAGDSRRVEVIYTAPAEGDHAGALVIASNDPNEAEVRVPLTGTGAGDAPPCLLISPNPLQFGAVRRGDERVRTAELISCGARPLTLTGLDRGQVFGFPLSDEFQLTAEPGWPQVLAAGQRAEVEVTYAPRLAGPDFGHFVVRNDSPEPAAQLNVQANGLPPLLEDVALHIRLRWDADDSDVDLHLIRPGGRFFHCDSDCFYQNPSPDWGQPNDFHDDPFLDVDNVQGFGPENINVEQPEAGVFRVIIHYYLDHYVQGEEGPSESVETDATVEIFVRGQLALQETRHLTQTDHTWEVADVDWPAGDVRPIHRLYDFNRGNIPACPGFFRP